MLSPEFPHLLLCYGVYNKWQVGLFLNWQTIDVCKYSLPKGGHTAATQQLGFFLINNQTAVEEFLVNHLLCCR